MRQRSAAPGNADATSAAAKDLAADFVARSATGAASAAADPLRTRRFFFGGLAAGVLAMSAIGVAAGTLVESPRDLAARWAAPAPAVLTAITRWHVLTDTLTVTGTVKPARTISVTASAPFTVITVTKMPARVGDRVRPGHVIAEVDGRPILLLQGRLPAYRDLHEGDSGPDVTQLRRALSRLGYADFDRTGKFGPSTALALRLLYRHLGYDAPRYHPRRASRGQNGPGPAHDLPPAGRVRPAYDRTGVAGLPVPDVYLPMSEVTYIPGRSALVASVSAQVGGVLASGHPVLRLAAGHPYVAAAIGAQAARLVRKGMSARVWLARPGPAFAGVLTRVGLLPVRRGADGPRAADPGNPGITPTEYPIEVATRRSLAQRLIGTTAWVTLTAPATAGPVLSVPVAAIFGSVSDQPATVTVITAGGRRKDVAVRTGPIADGLVAVQSIRPGALIPGERVLIGTRAVP